MVRIKDFVLLMKHYVKYFVVHLYKRRLWPLCVSKQPRLYTHNGLLCFSLRCVYFLCDWQYHQSYTLYTVWYFSGSELKISKKLVHTLAQKSQEIGEGLLCNYLPMPYSWKLLLLRIGREIQNKQQGLRRWQLACKQQHCFTSLSFATLFKFEYFYSFSFRLAVFCFSVFALFHVDSFHDQYETLQLLLTEGSMSKCKLKQ